MNSRDVYGLRANGSAHGDVFTLPEIVCYMLDIAGYTASRDLSHLTVLEPSCGEGAFLVEIAKRIKESALRFRFNFKEAFKQCVYAYDIDENKIEESKKKLLELGVDVSALHIEAADFLTQKLPKVDLVIGNPPYVRYEKIPDAQRAFCKESFETFHYRSDLYISFFEKSLKCLKKNGKHCFVCANRWLKNEYGKKLRRFIAQKFRLERIADLERICAFQEKVLAYPAITLISNNPWSTSISYAEVESVESLPNISFEMKPSPKNEDWSCIFNNVVVNENLYTIEELGFKIGIGVATGADHIFISKDLPKLVENELLLPALNAKNLSGNKLEWHGEYLLNPYTTNGELIKLADYPRVKKYLNDHKERLSQRHIAKKNDAKWYKTIDRIYPRIKNESKILLPDISGNRFIFLDEGNFYPLHNLYYITGNSTREQKILSTFLMSDVIRLQISSVTNNMNGGFPRWQSQHLRKLRLPNIKNIGTDVANLLVQSYDRRDFDSMNKLVRKVFESSHCVKKNVYCENNGQLALNLAV
ncbi:class I SAM-dependent methyltransferase [Fibrobacter succinogenes]|uniref:Eco57I restriction-modification methylase domain-containing protein n=1 Tax=Fibrobacter succinogenes TaxID=833 RepID=UPI0015690E20|nr:class I SAM-dependent methyltransferase [Fibrobacter succinogenes]